MNKNYHPMYPPRTGPELSGASFSEPDYDEGGGEHTKKRRQGSPRNVDSCDRYGIPEELVYSSPYLVLRFVW
jgi:hypothetical protein